MNEQHDYFVSYSSHDVAPARCIVERLLGEDRRVWFSEYYVRSDRQERFQQLINEAIDRSREAVLVVGARYADSPYTKKNCSISPPIPFAAPPLPARRFSTISSI